VRFGAAFAFQGREVDEEGQLRGRVRHLHVFHLVYIAGFGIPVADTWAGGRVASAVRLA